MQTQPTQPLQFARQILSPSTIASVAKTPYNTYGWAILDRWAYNSPALLKQLETQGEVVLLGRLLDQQDAEQKALTTEQAMAQRQQGAMPHEILQELEILTELKL